VSFFIITFVLSNLKQYNIMENSTVVFRKELNSLEERLTLRFNELLLINDEIVLFDQNDLDNDSPDNMFEVRNDITGDVFDVYIVKVSKIGLIAFEVNDSTRKHIIKLSDLASTLDRINLIELMELV
jgi:hypothetical protein